MNDISSVFINQTATNPPQPAPPVTPATIAVNFNLIANGSDLGGLGKYNQQPGNSLINTSGVQTQSAELDGKTVLIVKASMWCCWQDSVSKYFFGVKIIIPPQVLHMGYSPHYQYASGPNPPDPNDQTTMTWEDATSPSEQTNIDSIKFNGIFQVNISPIASGQSLSLTVTISNPTS